MIVQLLLPGHGRPGRVVCLALTLLLGATTLFFGAILIQRAQAQDFNNARIADCGLAELGTVRPTGWDQPGECLKSVQRWVGQAGGYFGPGGVISGYVESGAVQIGAGEATRGDIIQWTNGNDGDWSLPHTACIVENNHDGTYWVVHSNWDAKGLVSETRAWNPDPASIGRNGWYPTYWRFGIISHREPITGGHDAVGATSPSKVFYFAEGTCRPGFMPYFSIQNPGTKAADVTITYMKGDGGTVSQSLAVPAASRATISPKDKLGEADDAAHDFSARVACTNGQAIVAERPTYFDYAGCTGGSDAVGATAQAAEFFFAEGTTRPGFDTFFSILNPGDKAAAVTLTYMRGDGTTKAQSFTVPPSSRGTAHPADVLGVANDAAHDFSSRVTSTNGVPLVVERPMYFKYKGAWSGGSDVLGATSSSTCWYFAEGTTRPKFETYIALQNTGSKVARIAVSYMLANGASKSQTVTVPANSRGTVHPSDVLGSSDDPAHDFACSLVSTNGVGIVAERPSYFDYKGWDGGSDVLGCASPSQSFYFAEGTCRKGYDSYLSIQNPGDAVALVKVTYMKGDGSKATDQVTLNPRSRATVCPRDKLGTGDDAAHDFSTLVQCVNGQLIVAERPIYFAYTGGLTSADSHPGSNL
jgi:hypothetical protein